MKALSSKLPSAPPWRAAPPSPWWGPAPDLFKVLRVLVDRPGNPARFLLLGSASPALLRQGTESLAGRIEVVEAGGFTLDEVGAGLAPWHCGGAADFPARTQPIPTQTAGLSAASSSARPSNATCRNWA